MTENTGTIPTPPPPYPPAVRPPLRRSRTDRVIGGVAAGFARWLGIDPVIVRVVLVVLAVFGGSGLLLYAIGWLFIPDEGEPTSEADKLIARSREPGSTGRTLLIVAGVVVGLILLATIAGAGSWGGAWGGGGWLLLLAVGGLVLWLVNRPPTGTAAWTASPPTGGPVPAGGPVPPAPADPASTTVVGPAATADPGATVPVASAGAGASTLSMATAPTTVETTGYAYGGYGGYPGYDAPVPAAPPPPAPRPRSYLGLATMSLAVIAMGVLAALSITGVVTVPAVVVLSVGLGVLGVGLLVGSLLGRARWLIALALPLLLVTALVALIPSDLGTRLESRLGDGIGERVWTPATVAEAAGPFALSVGSAELDLTDLVLPAGATTVVPVSASVGMGDLQITVPEGVRVIVSAETGLGEIDVEGLPVVNGQNREVVAEMPGLVSDAAPTIELTAEVAIGNLEVSRA